MKTPRLLLAILAGAGLSVGTFGAANAADSPVSIRLDPQHSGTAVSPDFSGLSFEVSLLLSNESGLRYFRADNRPLLNLFHTLGIKNLRIGGNTSDRDVRQLPDQSDLDSLFAFAQAAGVKVIYCLRLHNGDPQVDAATAKYIMDHYAPLVDCFSIGQEPSAYPLEIKDTRPATERMGAAAEKYQYPAYAADWKRFAAVIIAAVPDVKFSGPGVHNNAVWAQKFMADFGHSNHVALITEHLYPGGAGGKVSTPEIGRSRMLGDDFVHAYQRLYDGFVPAAASNALPCRLEEVNNYFNGGATNVSNTFASALWGLDFMYWWAAHGTAGLNFHTGDKVAAGNALRPSKYTAYYSTTNGFEVRPLGYGIKAFDLGGHGILIPATVTNPDQLNLSAYAVRDQAGNLSLTLINKEDSPGTGRARVSISVAGDHSAAGQVIFLSAPNQDLAATSGETLGDAEIQNDGGWNGRWSPLEAAGNGLFSIELPAATAVIVRLSVK
jgi:hypothetical protein